MPKLLDFKCSACDHAFEYLMSGDDDRPGCPECGSLKVESVISTPLVTKLHDPDAKKAALLKRSAEHSLKGVQKMAGHRGSLPKNFGRKGSQIGD